MSRKKISFSRAETGYVVQWVEGDVVEIDIQEQETVFRRATCRVFGMNAPEPRGITLTAAEKAKERAHDLTKGVSLQMVFFDLPDSFLLAPRFKSYGRTMVRLFLPCGADVADLLVDEGYAVPYFMGLGKQPNPLGAGTADAGGASHHISLK